MKKLALGALIAFAVFGIAVAASAGFEWWQSRSDTASRVVVAPVDPVAVEPTTAVSAPVTAPLDTRVYEQEAISIAQTALAADPGAFAPERIEARVLDEAYQDRQVWIDGVDGALEPVWVVVFTVADPTGGRGDFLHHAAVWVDGISGEVKQVTVDGKTKQPTTTTLHPQVQAQGWERIAAIVEGHSDAWPWITQALDVAQISFFEDLPPECDSATGCYNPVTGDIWLTLDALRERDPSSFSFSLNDRDPSDTVVHELAHAYTRSFPQGSDLLDLFGQHYAGCSSRGLDTDRLITELLADTMAMAVTMVGSSMPYDYGYFGSGGFSGCLVESSQPDTALFGAVYSTLFNCDSEHALNVYEDHHDPLHFGMFFGNDADADAVLLTCYGIDCITPNRGCENVTDTDERRDAAEDRLHERRCADGLIYAGSLMEEPGWEHGCDAHIPPDVECIVIGTGYESLPGLFDVSGECIVADCTVEGPQGEPLPGHRKSFTWECIPIDRAEQHSDSQSDGGAPQIVMSQESARPYDESDISSEDSDSIDEQPGAYRGLLLGAVPLEQPWSDKATAGL